MIVFPVSNGARRFYRVTNGAAAAVFVSLAAVAVFGHSMDIGCWGRRSSALFLQKMLCGLPCALEENGPGVLPDPCRMQCYDVDGDNEITLRDWAVFANVITRKAFR